MKPPRKQNKHSQTILDNNFDGGSRFILFALLKSIDIHVIQDNEEMEDELTHTHTQTYQIES